MSEGNLNAWQDRARKFFRIDSLIKSELNGQKEFPLRIPLPRPSSGQLLENFKTLRMEFENLSNFRKEMQVSITYEVVNHRQLGPQTLPSEIVFSDREKLLQFTLQTIEFQTAISNWLAIQSVLPETRDFFLQRPRLLLKANPREWQLCMTACQFLMKNPQSGLHLRQLEIPNIDTKFIETNKKLISEVVQFLKNEPSKRINVFEETHGLAKESPRLRFRFLDSKLIDNYHGLTDVETSLTDLCSHPISCENVFIIENKTTGLYFPSFPKSMVFFELGFKALILKEIPWLHKKRLFYWGDIDTFGFSILSQLRQHLPHVQSLLMDKETLFAHQKLWVDEPAPYKGDCPYLTPEESEVFHGLRNNIWGANLRLEQERIPISALHRYQVP